MIKIADASTENMKIGKILSGFQLLAINVSFILIPIPAFFDYFFSHVISFRMGIFEMLCVHLFLTH